MLYPRKQIKNMETQTSSFRAFIFSQTVTDYVTLCDSQLYTNIFE